MPRYDYACETCGLLEERYSSVAERHAQVCGCGAPFTKVMTVPAAVQDDTIIGGFVQEHFGVKPETFYSKRDMARRAKELGLIPMVRHVGENHTDKSSKTSRWI